MKKSSILKTLPISELNISNFNHKQLAILKLGLKCKCCQRVARYILKYKNCNNSVSYCFAINDNNILTLDHIQPKSKGGKNTFSNLQVLCKECNNLKANKVDMLPYQPTFVQVTKNNAKVGKFVWRKRGKHRFPKKLGIIEKICKNPHTQIMEVKIKSSFYSFSTLLYSLDLINYEI